MDKTLYRNPHFMIYLTGIFISGLGSKLTTIALADKIFSLTGSGTYITLVYLLQGLPALFFGLIAGHLVDRHSKKAVFIMINGALALLSTLLAMADHPLILFAVVFLIDMADAFYSPVSTALLPLLVGRKQLASANGLKISVIGVNMIIGYAVAGLFVGFWGHTLPFIVDSFSYLFIACSAFFLKLSADHPEDVLENKGHFKESLMFIKNQPVIRRLFLIDLLTQFIIALQIPLTYIFVSEYLGGKDVMADRTGILFSAAGAGMALGGLFLKKFAQRNKLRLLSHALIFDSIFVFAFTLNRFFPATIVIYGAMGVIGAFMGSLLETAVQENTPQQMIGRVSGFIHSIADPVSILSLLIGSLLVQFINVQWIFLICALAECVTGIYFTLRKGVTLQSRK